MQNNITEITQRLIRSLDNDYNVVDMPAVIEIISTLERVQITKELLETTRLGRYVNELRRKTTNESLSKRAKELVKKWKSMVCPDTNGQIKPPLAAPQTSSEPPNAIESYKSLKRGPPNLTTPLTPVKRQKINGQLNEYEFSDNSNSSFKEIGGQRPPSAPPAAPLSGINPDVKSNIILINSDSNSSFPENKSDPHLEPQQPKKRGRKKGSKNHKNLLDEAESSFSNKLAVSRGNSKVKTTQELLASLQNKNTTVLGLPPLNSKNREDLSERAAKLTERVSIIDKTLYTNSSRYKQKKNKNVIDSGSVINDKSLLPSFSNNSQNADEDIIIVDDIDGQKNDSFYDESEENSQETLRDIKTELPPENNNLVPSLSLEEALALLPPIDYEILKETDEIKCTCILREKGHKVGDFSVEEEEDDTENKFEFVEDENCIAKSHQQTKIAETPDLKSLSSQCLPNFNGNFGKYSYASAPQIDETTKLYENVVPKMSTECCLNFIPPLNNSSNTKTDFTSENFKKYAFSEKLDDISVKSEGHCEIKQEEEEEEDRTPKSSDSDNFSEWHHVVDIPSYNGEILKILPYVIID